MLSDRNTKMRDRIHDAKYVRMDGVTIADNKEGLFDGDIENTISIDEHKKSYLPQNVWTGSTTSGEVATHGMSNPEPTDCGEWAEATSNVFGVLGLSSAYNSAWIHTGTGSICMKTNKARLFCASKDITKATIKGTNLWQGKDARVKCRMYVDLGEKMELYPLITATAEYDYHIEESLNMDVLP